MLHTVSFNQNSSGEDDFDLQSGCISAEDFHGALQEATNFPLRDFVLPYLKHALPSLQRDLSGAARANNQVSL